MRDTLTFFAGMFVLTALAELFVLRRWYQRRGIKFCVLSVAALSGVIWIGCSMASFWIRWGWKISREGRMSGSDWIVAIFSSFVTAVFFGVVALLPAGGVALVYRRLKRGNHDLVV